MVEKIKYSREELKEFEEIINTKLKKARLELKDLEISIENQNKSLVNSINNSDNSTEVELRDHLGQLASRQSKFINNLEQALERIDQGTYGICIDTGKLINKKRLCVVPHTRHSVVAKEKINK